MAANPAFVPKIKRNLTLPLFKFTVGVPRYLKLTGPIHIGKELKGKKDDTKPRKEPAHLCDVTDLESGEQGQIICNAVMRSTIQEEYLNETYIGKCFAITKNARQPGKEYDPFTVMEIEDPNAPAATDTPAPAASGSTGSAPAATESTPPARPTRAAAK